MPDRAARYAFISYVHEDSEAVEALEAKLRAAGVPTWRDTHGIPPGTRWRDEIRQAIRLGASFIACFSMNSESRDRSYMREEILAAIDELRLRPRERAWFFPVKLSPCEIPAIPLGSGETLADIQHIELFDIGGLQVQSLVNALWSSLGRVYPVLVNDWRPFNWRAIGPVTDLPMSISNGILTISAPDRDYGGLYGVISAEEVTDHRLVAGAMISSADEATQGYGMGIAPRGSLGAGAPVGWSLQIEWDPPYEQFQARAVTLPPGAWFGPTPEHRAIPLPIIPGDWFDLELKLAGRNVFAVVAGIELPQYAVPEDRGSPLVRAWGGQVSIRGFTIHSRT
jgi:TIR domain